MVRKTGRAGRGSQIPQRKETRGPGARPAALGSGPVNTGELAPGGGGQRPCSPQVPENRRQVAARAGACRTAPARTPLPFICVGVRSLFLSGGDSGGGLQVTPPSFLRLCQDTGAHTARRTTQAGACGAGKRWAGMGPGLPDGGQMQGLRSAGVYLLDGAGPTARLGLTVCAGKTTHSQVSWCEAGRLAGHPGTDHIQETGGTTTHARPPGCTQPGLREGRPWQDSTAWTSPGKETDSGGQDQLGQAVARESA